MAPIIELNEEIMNVLNPNCYQRRLDLEISESKQTAELNTNNWIKVPQEFSNLDYSFSVNPERLSYNQAVEKVKKDLKLELKNTSEDFLGRKFIGNMDWEKAMKLTQSLGTPTLQLNESIEFLNLLNLGMKGKINVYTEKGELLKPEYLKAISDDIIEPQKPSRAEWLDANFKTEDNKLYLKSNHILQKNKLIPIYSQLLTKDTLMEDKGISLESLFKTKTNQGFPSNKTKSEDFNYFYPRSDNNSAAGLDAGYKLVYLNCGKSPSTLGFNLGVRTVNYE